MGAADPLSERAAMMRESLLKSQTITDNVVSILGSFDHRLSALETAMRPTQVGPFSSSSSSFSFGSSENWGEKRKRVFKKSEFWAFGSNCSVDFSFTFAIEAQTKLKMADLGEFWVVVFCLLL